MADRRDAYTRRIRTLNYTRHFLALRDLPTVRFVTSHGKNGSPQALIRTHRGEAGYDAAPTIVYRTCPLLESRCRTFHVSIVFRSRATTACAFTQKSDYECKGMYEECVELFEM